jgi:hypothetical protein
VGTSAGTVELSPANGQDQRVLRCFVAAVAACKADSIRVNFINVDVVTGDVYAIERGGTPARCTVSSSSSTSINVGSSGPVTTARCRAASARPASATITCPGGQPFVLLATLTFTLPRAGCGSATVDYLSDRTSLLGADRGALACFAAAARACRAAGLRLAETGAGWASYWVFVIAGGGAPGRCAVTEYAQYYSASDNYGARTRSPDGWVTAVRTVPCRDPAVTGSGVTLHCSRLPGQVTLIPAAPSAP